jgi:tetratricopeptide (TPR) repeat protein
MTDHLTHPMPVADSDADSAALRRIGQLDPCRAWRADLAEAGLAEPLPEEQAAQWLLWLQIGTVFDRLRMLPVSERAAYARGTAGLWETAVRVTGAARFARVGAVMAEWSGEAPALDGFRELLWAVEQAEADGALQLAYCELRALTSLVAYQDLRAAYAEAQSGRVLRTIGQLDQALLAFATSALAARQHRDQWLMARVRLGTGVAYHTRGNYPAARKEFTKALRHAHPYVDLMIGAHLGILSASCTKKGYRSALRHGQIALRYASGDVHAEVEALSLLAELHTQVERYEDARGFCTSALGKEPRSHKLPCLLRNIVYASLCLNDTAAAKRYFPALKSSLTATPNPWEHASCEFVIGHAYASWGDHHSAKIHYELALRTAEKYHLNEIRWHSENAILRAQASASGHGTSEKLSLLGPASSWSCVDPRLMQGGVTVMAAPR